MNQTRTRWVLLAFTLSSLVTLQILVGCGAEIDVDLPTQQIPFSVDLNTIKAELETVCNCDLSSGTIPAGININQAFPVEPPTLPAQQVDFSNQPEIKQYAAALDKIKAVKIKFIRYNLTTNTVNYDLPSMDFYIDTLGATAITGSSKFIGQTNPIPAATVVNDSLQWEPGGQQALSEFIKQLKFAMMGKTMVTIDTSENRAIPTGQLVGNIEVGVTFTVEPL